jgi:predicted alpha/beta-hydrolase family hydrolase
MEIEKLSIELSESIGSVTGELVIAEKLDFLYVFAHGAGAGMNHPFMKKLAVELCKLGIGTLRFNFPFKEKGGRRPDPPAVAEKTVKRAIEVAHQRFPHVPLLAGGKSFGGRMTSQTLAKWTHQQVKAIVFVGFPLHAAGNPGTARADHLRNLQLPMLFLQGTRDALAGIDLMEKVTAALPFATMIKFEGADHSFKADKEELISPLAEAIFRWASAT